MHSSRSLRYNRLISTIPLFHARNANEKREKQNKAGTKQQWITWAIDGEWSVWCWCSDFWHWAWKSIPSFMIKPITPWQINNIDTFTIGHLPNFGVLSHAKGNEIEKKISLSSSAHALHMIWNEIVVFWNIVI